MATVAWRSTRGAHGWKVGLKWGFAAGVVLGLALLLGMAFGAYWLAPALDKTSGRAPVWPEAALHAVATHGGDTFGLATGAIDEEVEGVFTLDYATGDLVCYVLNPRLGSFNARFGRNVLADLGVERDKVPKFVMVTGNVLWVRGATVVRPSNAVLYVADTTSGNVAAYSVPWNKTLFSAGRPQEGAISLVGVFKGRNVQIRE